MTYINLLIVAVGLWLSTPAAAQTIPAPPKAPADPIQGALVIVGGGALPDAVVDAFFKLAGGQEGRLVVIPTASATANENDPEKSEETWRKRGIGDVTVLHTRLRDQANDPDFTAPLRKATAVWLGGGDQNKLTDTYLGTAVEKELHALLARGGVIGGTSAGAAVMSKLMIGGGKIPAQLATGFGLLPNAVVDQHFLKRNRLDRLIDTLHRQPGWFGLGIDEETAVVVKGRTITVVGKAHVLACLAAGKDRPASCQVLKPGDRADLVALSRAALARTQPPHPPLKPPPPFLPKGALIIGGGGGMPEGVWQKSIDLAGGLEARFVVIPTALDNPTKGEPAEAVRLRKMGVTHIRVLHAKSRAEANSADFVRAIDETSGVWISGGRQWRLVDAFLDTAADQALHRLLARGGVIAGSSAGASIQADYMVRGDPLGNLNIIAEGYERGLGFLKGVAIDQHFLKRKRPADMTELMARYPQLLGIGIDESTALIVQGEIMEIVGKSTVAVYDRTRPPADNGDADYQLLKAGTKFNLKTRKTVQP